MTFAVAWVTIGLFLNAVVFVKPNFCNIIFIVLVLQMHQLAFFLKLRFL